MDEGKYHIENQGSVHGLVIGDGNTVHQNFYLPMSSSVLVTPTERVWNVPFPRNPFFTGRDDLLSRLHHQLQAGQATALSQPQAISGLGGIGKTQIALEYAYQHRQNYQAVLWAQADTRATLASSYLSISALLNLPEKNVPESARVIFAVKNWLQHNTSWLLILDNADDLMLARDFLPPSVGGHVLLTTRAQATGRFARSLEIDILPPEQGIFFLLRRAGLLAPDAPLGQASEDEQNTARAIYEELGGLPLALDQAGAYIEETGCSLADYQHLFQHRSADLLAERRGLIDDHPQPVATTWSLSFERVEQKNPAAADLLRLCAFLAPDAIPETLITESAPRLGPELALVGADPYLLNKAIGVLRAYSLLYREAHSGTFPQISIHRLVQVVLREGMGREVQCIWIERAIQAINCVLPDGDTAPYSLRQHYLPHIQVCISFIEQWDIKTKGAIALLLNAIVYLERKKEYSSSLQIANTALEIQSENPRLPWLYVWRGIIYKRLMDYQHALEDMNRALNLSPNWAWAYIHRALVYVECEDYQHALEDINHALVLDPNSAWIYVHRAFLNVTVQNYQHALEDMNMAIALEPNRVWTHVHRALLYVRVNQYQYALEDMNTAIALEPNNAWAHTHRAIIYRGINEYRQALQDLDCAVQLDPSNPWILVHRAVTYRENKEYQHALQDLDRALEINTLCASR